MRLSSSAAVVAVSTLLSFGCGNSKTENIEARSMEQLHAEQGVPVRTMAIAPGIFATEYSYYSILSGVEETTATSMLSDTVEKIHFKVGDRVRKDDIIVTFPIDNPAAKYYQAKVAFEHAETTLGRIKNLYENGGISLQDYDNTRTQFEVAKANWNAVQQTVTVEAPIGGVITNLAVREADKVNPGDALFTVARTHTLKTEIWVADDRISDVSIGDPASAEWNGITINGKVVQVDLSLNSDKQAFGVTIEFDNSDGRMLNGVNAEIILKGEEQSDVISIARKNILKDSEDYYVFIAYNDTAVRRQVALGRSKELDVEILDGLETGDMLITEGQILLKDDMKISVIAQ